MTKKLEEILDMSAAKEVVEQDKKQAEKEQKQEKREHEKELRNIEELDKINSALPAVKGLGEMADKELNEVAEKSMDAYEDLMDLGMNVESRYSGRVFEVAATMLKTNLEAKNAKLDKKLKTVELQLKKEKMDRDSSGNDVDVVQGEGYVVSDRNSLIEKLKNMDK
jgi:ATP phosphoribosyltransferase regulatory subunit HisZ